jgi:hypothetical protein
MRRGSRPPPPPFDTLKWCFALLAVVIVVMLAASTLGVVGCAWMVISGRAPAGTCMQAGILGQARELMSEALTAVLALLLAARGGGPPGPPGPPPGTR